MLQIGEQSWPALEAYFGRAKAACLCSYCYKRHLWFYDGGRLGKLKIVTLRIGANLKHFHLSSGGSKLRFREQKHWRARRNACTAGYRRVINIQRIQVSRLCGPSLSVIVRNVSRNFQALYGVYQHGMRRNTFCTAWNIKLLKIIRRELFFNQTSLPRQPQCCCVLSGTVKIRNFKIRKLLQRFIPRLPSTWCKFVNLKFKRPRCFDFRVSKVWWPSGEHMWTKNNWERVLCTLSQCLSDAWLISTCSKPLPHDQQQCEAYSTFSSKLQCPENIVIPLEGVLMISMSIMISKHLQSGLEFTMKKDSDLHSSWRLLYFPATKEEH